MLATHRAEGKLLPQNQQRRTKYVAVLLHVYLQKINSEWGGEGGGGSGGGEMPSHDSNKYLRWRKNRSRRL
jgi:hypothetical protein